MGHLKAKGCWHLHNETTSPAYLLRSSRFNTRYHKYVSSRHLSNSLHSFLVSIWSSTSGPFYSFTCRIGRSLHCRDPHPRSARALRGDEVLHFTKPTQAPSELFIITLSPSPFEPVCVPLEPYINETRRDDEASASIPLTGYL